MPLRDTIRRRRHRIVGDLAISAIAVLTVAAPASAARADRPPAADDTVDPTGARGVDQPLSDLDVVEVRRVPDTASLLATYRVSTDNAGDVSSHERLQRFNRGELSSVVSDAPEDLRAKRRDLDTHDVALELTSGLAHVDSGGTFSSTSSS